MPACKSALSISLTLSNRGSTKILTDTCCETFTDVYCAIRINGKLFSRQVDKGFAANRLRRLLFQAAVRRPNKRKTAATPLSQRMASLAVKSLSTATIANILYIYVQTT
jgi:hypothetical protein